MVAGFIFGLGASAGGLIFVFGVFALNNWFNGQVKSRNEEYQRETLTALQERNGLTAETNSYQKRIAEAIEEWVGNQ